MSDASNAMTQALTAAQEAKDAKTTRNREFTAAVDRSKLRQIQTLEAIRLLAPTSGTVAAFETHLGLDVADAEESFGAGHNAIRELLDYAAPYLTYESRSGAELRNLEMMAQRLVGAFVASAQGAAVFFDAKAEVSRNLKSALRNADRDEDRMGIDGQANKAQQAQMFAAQAGARAYALLNIAEGAAAAYKDVLGSEWKPYEGRNRRSLDERAQATIDDALGF